MPTWLLSICNPYNFTNTICDNFPAMFSRNTYFCDIPPTLLQFYLFRFAVLYYRDTCTSAEWNFVFPTSLRIPSEKMLSFRSAQKARTITCSLFKPIRIEGKVSILHHIPKYSRTQSVPTATFHLVIISVNAIWEPCYHILFLSLFLLFLFSFIFILLSWLNFPGLIYNINFIFLLPYVGLHCEN